jgi:hypothetical protein
MQHLIRRGKKMNQSNEFIEKMTLYAPHVDYKKMIEQINNYARQSQFPIRFALFTSMRNAFEYFTNRTDGEFKIETKHFSKNIYTGELSRKYGIKDKKQVNGQFLLFKHDKYDIYLILTNESTAFFEHGLIRFINKKYPIFAFPFFFSWEMEMMLNTLAKTAPKNVIMLTQISRKSRIMSRESRKKKESDLTWTDLPYKDVFRQTRQSDAWVEKVYFDLVSEMKTDRGPIRSKILSGFISRDGIFKCEMEFKQFYETIVEKSIEIFFRRKEQLSNRARIKETNYESKPLVIEFDEPIFKNREQNKRLLEALKTLPHSAGSVIHSNPYLHATVIDYIDNSNYEIWVLSENRISIVPQTICSMSSLNRLCDHVSKEFQEGIVKDLKEVI